MIDFDELERLLKQELWGEGKAEARAVALLALTIIQEVVRNPTVPAYSRDYIAEKLRIIRTYLNLK